MSGFGSFGTSSGFGGSLFSSQQPQQTATTSGLFGSSTTQPSSGGLFGSSATTTASPFSFSSAPNQTIGQQTGTGHVKFQAPRDSDTITKNGVSQSISTLHQCITAMKEYENKSLEELRLEDYVANRKFPTTTSIASGFGTQSTGGLFGSTSTGFGGTTSTTSGGGLFGSTQPKSLFGTTTTPATTTQVPSTGLFGASTQQKSLFGSPATTTTTSTTTSSPFGGFGASTQQSTGFGTTASQPTSLFGGAGTTTTGGGLFGTSTPSTGTTSGGLFGSAAPQAQKPLFGGFGSTTSTTTATQPAFSFGASTTTPASTTNQPSIFGTTATSQSPLTAAKPFGSTSTSFGGFGTTTTPSTGAFGTTTTTTAPSTGLFGSTTPAKPFGGLGTTSAAVTSGFGGFGSTATPTTTTTTPAQTSIFGGFGAQPAATASTTASPFGGLGTTTSAFGTGASTGGGLFGSSATQPTATGGGLFGSTTTTQPATAFGGGLGGFGTQQSATTTAPQTTSLFGSTGIGLGGATTGGGLFGSTATTAQPSTAFGTGLSTNLGGGLSSGLGTFSLTGQTGTSALGTGLGLGGAGLSSLQTQQQQQQQQIQLQQQQAAQTQPLLQQQIAALTQSPYGTGSLLKSSLSELKEDILKPVSPLAQRPYITEATSPQKTAPITDFKGGLSQPIRITPKPLSSVSLNKKTDLFEGLDDEETPCFMPRKNVKKLLLKPTQSDPNLSRRSSSNTSINGDNKPEFLRKPLYSNDTINYNIPNRGSTGGNTGANNTTFGPYTLGQITYDLTNTNNHDDTNENQCETIDSKNHVQFNLPSSQNSPPHPANLILERPGYFTIPSIQDLAALTDEKGNCFAENFAIGRVDYGCITFPGITNLANMNLDEIVHIRRKEVHVYPDDSKKPPVGQGLNKSAEITLHRIWPTDKQSKMPITDPNVIINMGYDKKIEKATQEMDAQFVDYDPVTGSWTFKVKHFSKYGLQDSDDDGDDDDETVVVQKQTRQNFKPLLNLTKPLKNTAASILNTVDSIDRDEKIDHSMEKLMLQKQMKLIEMRRMELMQREQKQQHWDVISEYVPTIKQQKYVDQSNLNLQLSSDTEQDSDAEKNEPKHDDKKSLCKALMIDDDNETEDDESLSIEDENKENKLYPSLRKKSATKNLKFRTKKEADNTKLYPSLNKFEAKNENEEIMSELAEVEHDQNLGENNETMMPFLSVQDRFNVMRTGLGGPKPIVDAFFKEESREFDDFYTMDDMDDNRSLKLGGFNQKPITVGLLKRGLGGISNLTPDNKLTIGDTNQILTNSMIGDRFHGRSKVNKPSTISLTSAEAEHKIGTRSLKPTLWNRFQAQKASKYLDNDQDLTNIQALAINSSTKISSSAVVPISETLKLIELKNSITNGFHWCLADAGLFNSRRFRVSFSLYPTSCTYTQLAAKNTYFKNSVQLVTPILVNIGNLNTTPEILSIKLDKIKQNCERYLQIQLEMTEFSKNKTQQEKYLLNNERNKLPYLSPKFTNELIKRFAKCTEELRNSIGDHPDADNIEHMKNVWSLCQSLWGDIPDQMKSNPLESSNLSLYETEQIRKRLLGQWLSDSCSHRIERECKILKFNKNKENYLCAIFSHLTGNRLLDACNKAVDNLDFRLALLLSQSSGGNDIAREMIRKQLNDWHSSTSDKFINIDRLKLYTLISGQLTYNLSGGAAQNSQFINVCENLDWKRQLAIHLWYHCLPIHNVSDALNAYENSIEAKVCSAPVPPYIEDCVTKNTSSDCLVPDGQKEENASHSLFDTCFHLIKLYCNNTHPIESIISPLNHCSNQLDFRLSWHLAMALVALHYNHVSKSCLETLHDSYAAQLQSIGLWHWSIYVLMHIENEQRREALVRNYISKNVSSSADLKEQELFLIEKLGVPAEWIFEYKALKAKYEHSYDNQIQLLLKAHKWNDAHKVLCKHLASDLFIKQNFTTLGTYLSTLSKESQFISRWSMGGQVYMDYLSLKQKTDDLFSFSESENQNKEFNCEELLFKEIHGLLMNLSSRLKDFDTQTSKKLLVLLQIAKLVLKIFHVFDQMKIFDSKFGDESESSQDEEDYANDSPAKMLTKMMIEKAERLTSSEPDQNILVTMLLKHSKYMHDFLTSKNRL